MKNNKFVVILVATLVVAVILAGGMYVMKPMEETPSVKSVSSPAKTPEQDKAARIVAKGYIRHKNLE